MVCFSWWTYGAANVFAVVVFVSHSVGLSFQSLPLRVCQVGVPFWFLLKHFPFLNGFRLIAAAAIAIASIHCQVDRMQ